MRSEKNKKKIEIGERIQKQRKAKKYTQKDMAKQLHITEGHYKDIEQGYYCPSKWILDDICVILGCSPEYILFGS